MNVAVREYTLRRHGKLLRVWLCQKTAEREFHRRSLEAIKNNECVVTESGTLINPYVLEGPNHE